MCTIILNWDKRGLIVGANRDEISKRPAQNWKHRKNVFCPLDVKKGTWIGVNNSGLFVGLVNLIQESVDSLMKTTRGKLVTEALKKQTADEAMVSTMNENPLRYKNCILVLADRKNLFALVFSGQRVASFELDAGLHTFTEWGFDRWEIPRNKYVLDNFEKQDIKDILQRHGNGTVENEICVHDPLETFQTRSSCVIKAEDRWNKFVVEYTNKRPCKTLKWAKEEIKL